MSMMDLNGNVMIKTKDVFQEILTTFTNIENDDFAHRTFFHIYNPQLSDYPNPE